MRSGIKIGYFLLFLCTQLEAQSAFGSSSNRSNSSRSGPFNNGSYTRDDIETRTAIIQVGGRKVFTPAEATIVDAVWGDMRQSYTYSEDGELEYGKKGLPMAETPEIRVAFYRWLSQNVTQREAIIDDKCKACPGGGVIIVHDPDYPLRITRETCETCGGTGKRKVKVIYTLVCQTNTLPPKAPTPRELNQTKLEADAAKGVVSARLKLASVYKTGSKIVPRNEEKAIELYFALVSEGNLEGLRGYADIIMERAVRPEDKRYAQVINNAYAQLSGNAPPKKVEVGQSSYLEQFETTILVNVTIDLFVKKLLNRKYMNCASLIGVLSESGQSPVRTIVIRQMKVAEAKYGRETVSELMTLAEKLDRDAFAILGSICESGVGNIKNLQAAHVYYSIASGLKGGANMQADVDRLSKEYSVDSKMTTELLQDFFKLSVQGKCPRTFIQAVFNIRYEPK